MVDSGATTKFMNRRFVRENKVRTQKLKYPIPLYNIDGSLNKAGSISEVAVLHMKIGDHEEKVVFTVTDIGPEDVILGLESIPRGNPIGYGRWSILFPKKIQIQLAPYTVDVFRK